MLHLPVKFRLLLLGLQEQKGLSRSSNGRPLLSRLLPDLPNLRPLLAFDWIHWALSAAEGGSLRSGIKPLAIKEPRLLHPNYRGLLRNGKKHDSNLFRALIRG